MTTALIAARPTYDEVKAYLTEYYDRAFAGLAEIVIEEVNLLADPEEGVEVIVAVHEDRKGPFADVEAYTAEWQVWRLADGSVYGEW